MVGCADPGAGLDGQPEGVALDHPGGQHRRGLPGLGRGQQARRGDLRLADQPQLVHLAGRQRGQPVGHHGQLMPGRGQHHGGHAALGRRLAEQRDLRRRQEQRDRPVLGPDLVELVLGVGLREPEEHRDHDRGGRDDPGQPRHPRHPGSGAARPCVGSACYFGRQLAGARRGGEHPVAQPGRRLGGRVGGRVGGGEGHRGGHLAEAAYLAGTRLAAAQVAGEPVALGPRLQRVQRVGAGKRVQVAAEEPHVSSPPGSRASG